MSPLGFRKPEAAVASPDILPSLFGLPEGAHAHRSTNFLWSLLLHTLAIAMLLYLVRVLPSTLLSGQTPKIPDWGKGVVTVPCELVTGCGGGGNREKLPASRGVLPKITNMQITPPTTHVMNLAPKLPVEETIVAPNVELPRQPGPLGDPFHGVAGPPSDGPGNGSGIGDSCCGGIGRVPGRGAGGDQPYMRFVPGRVTAPHPIYAPDPDYSEEGRKVKAQGVVVLWVGIGPDGRVRDVRVQRSLGYGLDERAVDAVRRWRFKPATVDDRPVAVQINVEVRFRLY